MGTTTARRQLDVRCQCAANPRAASEAATNAADRDPSTCSTKAWNRRPRSSATGHPAAPPARRGRDRGCNRRSRRRWPVGAAIEQTEREILNGKIGAGPVGRLDSTGERRIVRAVQKRKWFQVTRSRSQTLRRHATAQSFAARIAGCSPFSSPPPSFESYGSKLPGSPASFSGQNRHLEAAFHSPETTARLQATISRSKLPAYFFDTLPDVRLARSDSDSPARSGSPRCAQARYRNPVARLASGISNVSADLHSPSGSFKPLRIKAFNPVPRRKVRLPSAPDCLSLPGIESILLVPIPDHRSRLAKRSAACCSSDLLEPLSS